MPKQFMAGTLFGVVVATTIFVVVMQATPRHPPAQTAVPTFTQTFSSQEEAESALEQFAEMYGDTYAGLCRNAHLPEDVGKVCSVSYGWDADSAIHLLGCTFSDTTFALVFERWEMYSPVDRAGNGYITSVNMPVEFKPLDLGGPACKR